MNAAMKYPDDTRADVGLVLLNLSLQPVAFDQGALTILDYVNRPGIQQGPATWLPEEVQNLLRDRRPADPSPMETDFRIGGSEYLCRIYLLDSHPGPMLALHFEKHQRAKTIDEVAAKYNLTEREQQVLSGISSLGLTNKELAERMNISPLTVKAFLRLIMVKMGTTTRAGIVAKILNNGVPQFPQFPQRDAGPALVPPKARHNA